MKQLWLLFVLFLGACGQPVATGSLASSPATPTFPPVPTLDAAAVALGKTVYDAQCAKCHGANLEGAADWKTPDENGLYPPPPHDETGHTWHHADSILIESVQLGASRLPEEFKGQSNMPAFVDVLSDEQITAVLTYIKNSWPEETRQFQWEATNIMDNP